MDFLLIAEPLWVVESLARKPVKHTSCVNVVTPTDRSKKVCNRCVIKCLHFCDVAFLCISESDILPFLYNWQLA